MWCVGGVGNKSIQPHHRGLAGREALGFLIYLTHVTPTSCKKKFFADGRTRGLYGNNLVSMAFSYLVNGGRSSGIEHRVVVCASKSGKIF